jgi:hypothetical protein
MSFDEALPEGTVVGEFEIRRVLGYGGFGIVYEAYEPMLDRRVALKEFFLRGFSRRDGATVTPVNTEEAKEMFDSGLTRFVREARLLSMLNERTRSDGSLVAVYRVFQAHGTAFMAMRLYEGGTLKQWVKDDPARVTEGWLVRVLTRLLDALDGLHSLPGENLVHRDVSPDNIILQPDGTPVLLDFGATRKANDAQTSLIFKPGYSPIEQYTDALPQGPWTDLYALCVLRRHGPGTHAGHRPARRRQLPARQRGGCRSLLAGLPGPDRPGHGRAAGPALPQLHRVAPGTGPPGVRRRPHAADRAAGGRLATLCRTLRGTFRRTPRRTPLHSRSRARRDLARRPPRRIDAGCCCPVWRSDAAGRRDDPGDRRPAHGGRPQRRQRPSAGGSGPLDAPGSGRSTRGAQRLGPR